jgi:hypothetical protein
MNSTHLDLIRLGNTFRNANNQADLVLDGLNDRVGGTWWRHIDNACIRLGFPDSLSNSDITQQPIKEERASHLELNRRQAGQGVSDQLCWARHPLPFSSRMLMPL